jgi:hypothetical protein
VLNHDNMREQWKTGVIGDPKDKAGGVLGTNAGVEDHRLPASFATSLFVVVYFKTSSKFPFPPSHLFVNRNGVDRQNGKGEWE